MGRNTVGGKNFKKFKTGSEGFRAKASREAAEEIVYIMTILFNKVPQPPLEATDLEASKYLLVGRVMKKFGFGRYEIYCHDGTTRQCRIRGLLRKKGQVYIDVNTMVAVSLTDAISDGSDDETDIGGGASIAGGGYIIGTLSDKHIAQLRKTTINTKIFVDANSTDDGTEDLFDRTDLLNEDEEEYTNTIINVSNKKGKTVEEDIDLDTL
jgi:translation initiation factor IF-1